MSCKKVPYLLLILLLGSCGTYLPASEGIIYHDQDREPYAVERAFPFAHGEIGGTLSYLVLPGKMRSSVREQYGDGNLAFRENYLIGPPIPTFTIPLAYKAAAGISAVPIYPAVDATVHLFADTWLTGSVQFPLFLMVNRELILQRPVYRVRNGGVSVGAFYRFEHLAWFREGEQLQLEGTIPSTFPVEWAGGRISAQLPTISSDERIRFHFNAGYSGQYDSALFTIGIGIYIRPGPRQERPRPIRF